jgi:hypothetical protein
MADPPPYPSTGTSSDETRTGSHPGDASGRPRWKAAALVIIVLALLLVMLVLHLTGTFGPASHG